MKITCTSNPKHKRFYTTVHITQGWEVDSNGNFIDTIQTCIDVIRKPNIEHLYECMECAEDAVAED